MLALTNSGEWTLLWPAVLRWDAPRSRALWCWTPSLGEPHHVSLTLGRQPGTDDSLGLSTEPGVGEASRGFPRLDPDGWLVRISAPEHRENGRATGA